MEAGLPFATLLALSRKTRAAAGASSSVRLLKAAAEVGAGCPSFGGQRTVASAQKQEDSQRLSKRLSLSIENTELRVGLIASNAWAWCFLRARFSYRAVHAACASSVGMLRHPNTTQGCLSKSAA